MRRSRRQNIEFAALLTAALAAALLSAGAVGPQLDKDAYDWIYRLYRPPDWEPQSILLAIDEESFRVSGGVSNLREALAEGLERIAPAGPKAVAIDVLLADDGDEDDDKRLAAAIRHTPNVVLPCELVAGQWEDPLPEFSQGAAAKGHIYIEPDPVCRRVELEKAAGHERRWALAFEVYRVATGKTPVESQRDLEIDGVIIPAPANTALDRVLRIRYRPPDKPIPQVTLAKLRAQPALAKQFAGKTVFVGVTAQTAGDRRQTPYLRDAEMPGVEIHANIFETLASRRFLVNAPEAASFVVCLLLVIGMGTAFARRSYWIGAAVAATACFAPYICFTQNIVLPATAPLFSAVFSAAVAAAYQYFVVRKRMVTAEGDKSRYQEAMHFVTHEMRTPLTTIQGSNELIGRYAMTEEKRKQMAQLINSESKRLGKMIEIFLSVERLSAGQLELKKEQFGGMELMTACVERVRPLAERKQIGMHVAPGPDAPLLGDRGR